MLLKQTFNDIGLLSVTFCNSRIWKDVVWPNGSPYTQVKTTNGKNEELTETQLLLSLNKLIVSNYLHINTLFMQINNMVSTFLEGSETVQNHNHNTLGEQGNGIG